MQVWNPDGVILIPDHYIFTDDPRANRNVDILRGYAQKYKIKHFYDITDRSNFQVNPGYKGVCHVALAQEGHAIPGEVLFGTDSHTCTAGAFGMFASGIGNTDAGFVLGTGKLLIKVPPTLKFNIVGEMPKYLLAKDLILHIIGEIGVRPSQVSFLFSLPSVDVTLPHLQRMLPSCRKDWWGIPPHQLDPINSAESMG